MLCQVWFREGIHPRVPEGSGWEEVEVPKEVAQLSAGPGDLLWALLWDGNLLVRTGLSLDSPTGQYSLSFTFTPKSFPTKSYLSSFFSFLEHSLWWDDFEIVGTVSGYDLSVSSSKALGIFVTAS